MNTANVENVKYNNPVIPGFFPDPSIVRVNRDFYLVTSSFEYYPGVPIFHSRNLVDWKQIGHVLTRKSQVNLSNRKSSEGIFAPVIRYHDGLFYMITTDVAGIGNFYVTAADPAGPWSDPYLIPHGGIDPSLFFDEDGKVYVTTQMGWDYESHAIQYEIDIKTAQALTEPGVVWKGDGGPWTEGPHLYKIKESYYMMSASGGTGSEHREIIGRSAHPYGPFERLSDPILTHNKRPEHVIQFLGHADLVDDCNGNWWAVFLGVRHDGRSSSVLGRETFLAPIIWSEDGWPMIDNNEGTVALHMQTDRLPDSRSGAVSKEILEEFDEPVLSSQWSAIRYTDESFYSLTDRLGTLRLTGQAATLNDAEPTAFIGRRQQHYCATMSTFMEFDPTQCGEEAGLAVRLSDQAHYEIGVKQTETQRFVVLQSTKAGLTREVNRTEHFEKWIFLSIEACHDQYVFSFSLDGQAWTRVGEEPADNLSPEKSGGFTGVCVGMYATGNEKPSQALAYFDWFKYDPVSE